MSTRSVCTAEVIKVVRAGLDKEQDEAGDGFKTNLYSVDRIPQLVTRRAHNKRSASCCE